MAKFDNEDFIEMVQEIMQDAGAGLNSYITKVEAEKAAKNKGLTPALETIPNDSYFVQTWTNAILNKKRAVFFGIEDVSANDGGGGVVAKTYRIFCEIIMVSTNQRNDDWRRISRYSRAMEELFSANFAPAMAEAGRVKVEQVRPIAFKLALDSDEEVKVGGVSLTITLV